MEMSEFARQFSELTDMKPNPYHPLVWILGEPEIGEGVYIGAMSMIYAKGARVVIGDHCDFAPFTAINCADSHRRCIGLSDEVDKRDIIIGDHVFIGLQSVVKGGAHIGHHSVIAAGTVVDAGEIPPYSLVSGNPMTVRPRYFEAQVKAHATELSDA